MPANLAARPYRRWYNDQGWLKRRAQQLAAEPLCAECLRHGKIEPAVVADHVIAHRGDLEKFRLGGLQSLCKRHHDQKTMREKGLEPPVVYGSDGWPLSTDEPAPTSEPPAPIADALDLVDLLLPKARPIGRP